MSAVHLKRSDRDLSIALGCVIYDALILATAIQVRRSRGSRPRLATLKWSEAQIAIDVILLKTRVLVDFLTSRGKNPDDIRASDFKYAPSHTFTDLPDTFREAINKRSAHLSWTRVADSLPEFAEVDEGIDAYAHKVMLEVRSFTTSVIASGIVPVLERHQAYLTALETAYSDITGL